MTCIAGGFHHAVLVLLLICGQAATLGQYDKGVDPLPAFFAAVER